MPELDALKKIESICDLLIDVMEGKTGTLSVTPPEKDASPYVLRAFVLQGKGDRLAALKKPQEAHDFFLDAERQFMDVLESWPDDLNALTGYALTLQKLGTADQASGESFLLAKDCFRRAMALDEAHGQPYITCTAGYAILLMRNNEDAEAVKVFDTALEHCPNNMLLLRGREVAHGRVNRKLDSELLDFKPLNAMADNKPDFGRTASDILAKVSPQPRFVPQINIVRLKL